MQYDHKGGERRLAFLPRLVRKWNGQGFEIDQDKQCGRLVRGRVGVGLTLVLG